MHEHAFDAFTQRLTAAISRRRSLLTLGATALTAAVARPTPAAAGCVEVKRRLKERCRRSRERTCQRQKTQCVNAANAFCNGDLGCVAATFPCCDLFRSDCNATAAAQCLLTVN